MTEGDSKLSNKSQSVWLRVFVWMKASMNRNEPELKDFRSVFVHEANRSP